MCGIVGYIGNKPIEINALIKNAQFNIHRGDDGVGLLYISGKNWQLDKLLYSIDEINSQTLKNDKFTKLVRKGSFGLLVDDEDKYSIEQKKFHDSMDKLLHTKTPFAILHHRKATYGGNEVCNLHPFEYNNKWYFHNGTARIDSIKKLLELDYGMVFKSQTDTEVLASIYSKLCEKFGDDRDKIYKTLSSMFPAGFGVLLEIDTDGKVTIIKDLLRRLYIYEHEDGSKILISEPTPFIRQFTKVIKLDNGIQVIGEELKGIDMTEMTNKCKSWWLQKNIVSGNVRIDTKCDSCGVVKPNIPVRLCLNHTFTTGKPDRCFECIIHDKGEESSGIKDTEVEGRKYTYANYIGESGS